MYFTLDAGPNVHLLYPANDVVDTFIKDELQPLCENERIIWDEVGQGATKL